MAKVNYILYCDESVKKGKYYSNFYGGALLKSSDRQAIDQILNNKKSELNLYQELKWTKITSQYEDKYLDFIRTYFEFIRSGRIKIRIMFTHNYRPPLNLTQTQKDESYFLLYYQFLKHAFGFAYCNPNNIDRIFVELLLDQIPAAKPDLIKFKDQIYQIENRDIFQGTGVYYKHEQIAGVDSKNHVILQGLDLILGSIQFRLNEQHKEKPEGQRVRGKRTIAKERVYKEINRQIRSIYPNFNIGVSTAQKNGTGDRWEQAYRHWSFKSSKSKIDPKSVKPR